MAGRPIPLDSIDEAFAKILIEELAHRDQIADLGDDVPPETMDSGSHRWETIAAFELPADPDKEQTPTSPARPTSRPAAPPVPLEPSPTGGRGRLWQFCITYPDGRQCTLPLEAKPIVLGRAKENAIVLQCEEVSRQHARISVDDHGPRVDDLGSRNGIFVNGIKVPAAYLKSGDIVRIGKIKIQLILAD